jgi:hypothetical protein
MADLGQSVSRAENHTVCRATGKRRYRSQLAAERIMAVLVLHRSNGHVPRRAYHCEHCGGWHLTSQEKGRRPPPSQQGGDTAERRA